MAFTFTDTHNMIAYLTKSDVSEGFDQIINFLNASAIKYALIVNPNIYVSCIKQFWSSILVKKVNDVTRLQALIDRKRVIITKAIVREALLLDDAESIDCLPNEEIFTELSRMGYEKPSTKLTFYKAFFSPQWKFLIHTILQCMSTKRTSWNEFSSFMASAVICLSTGRKINFPSTFFTALCCWCYVDVVPAATAEPSILSHTPTTQPPPLSQELSSTSQVIPTPPPSPTAQPSSPPQQQQPSQPTHDAKNSMDLLQTLLETCTALTRRVENLEQDKITQALEIIKLKQRVKRLEKKNKLKVFGLRKLKKVLSIHDDELEPVELKEVVEVVTTAKLMTEVVTAAVATTPITIATSAARRRKRVVIRDPKENATPSIIIHSEPRSKYKGKRIMVQDPKPLKKQAQIEQDGLMQEMPNDDDDVYTEATPLALKVPVVDYAIYIENNKPYYKIIRADGSHQLFLSFLSLLRNFDRDDLEVLWQLVKERFASSKPKNLSDNFLLTTLTYMFEKPDVQAQIWKNQRRAHGLAKVQKLKIVRVL
uniref:Synaptobrevin, longin-like domain protein n=1 Tax=Tanacetum cinerariifolium TaxID=118510 RepID=A0A6L2M676_TANCI|nr:hypothetical protein [Tanacetum cinerariifolium]